MAKARPRPAGSDVLENAIRERGKEGQKRYVLRLSVGSMNSRARFAIENLKEICEKHLAGCYDLEVVDLRDEPSLAAKERVVATPMLIKELPAPVRRFIGDMADAEKILVALEVKPE